MTDSIDNNMETLLKDISEFGDVTLRFNKKSILEYQWYCYIAMDIDEPKLRTYIEFYAPSAYNAVQLMWLSLSAHINSWRVADLESYIKRLDAVIDD